MMNDWNKSWKKVYVCSPLKAPTKEGIEANRVSAGEYAKLVSSMFNCRAVAPHAVLPLLLDDNDPKEREIALDFGLKYLATCNALVICGDVISSGMEAEIARAKLLNLPVLKLSVLCRF